MIIIIMITIIALELVYPIVRDTLHNRLSRYYHDCVVKPPFQEECVVIMYLFFFSKSCL